MTLIEKQALAASYANAWRAVKGGGGAGRLMRVDVEPHGWFTIHYGYPAHSSRVRAEKLLLGLEVLTRRLSNGDGHVIQNARELADNVKGA